VTVECYAAPRTGAEACGLPFAGRSRRAPCISGCATPAETDRVLSQFLASLRARLQRHPRWTRVAGVVLLVAIVVTVVAVLADSPKKEKATAPTTTTVPRAPVIPRVKLRIGRVFVQNVGPPAHVRRPVRRELLAAAQRYVDDAIIAPLEKGHLIAGYGKMYDPALRSGALGHDLAVLTEAKMGFRRDRVHATASPVRVDAIGGPDGRPALVALTFALNVDTPTAKGPLAIRRRTELTFVPEFGRWRVTAYRVSVQRSLGRGGRKAHARAG